MAWSEFSSGTKAKSSEVNANFNMVRLRMFGSETSGNSTTMTTGTATLATVPVGAGSCNTAIWIILNYNCYAIQQADGDKGVPQLQIHIGESGSETSKKTLVPVNPGADSNTITSQGTYTFYYEPDASEKSNGFNVLIMGTNTVSGSSPPTTASAGYDEVYVNGI